jgi:hypothetical protein
MKPLLLALPALLLFADEETAPSYATQLEEVLAAHAAGELQVARATLETMLVDPLAGDLVEWQRAEVQYALGVVLAARKDLPPDPLNPPPDILEAAYNDSQGVTARFNLNVLHRLNREFGSNFKPDQFLHRAVYNLTAGRIEMYLDSQQDQAAQLGDQIIHFNKGESILTEHSHKYTVEGFAALAEAAGFHVHRVWTDPQQLFSVQYCQRI